MKTFLSALLLALILVMLLPAPVQAAVTDTVIQQAQSPAVGSSRTDEPSLQNPNVAVGIKLAAGIVGLLFCILAVLPIFAESVQDFSG
jgi:hypothetical protein